MTYLMFLVLHAINTLNEYGLKGQREALAQCAALYKAGKCTDAVLEDELEMAWRAALAWEARVNR